VPNGSQTTGRGGVKRLATSTAQDVPGGSGGDETIGSRKTLPNQPNVPSPERIGEIAHDFNNILTLVLGYGENLLKVLPEGHPGRTYAEEICRAANDGKRLSIELVSPPSKAPRARPGAQ